MRQLLKGFIDLIYPSGCHICGQASEEPLCSTCLSSLSIIQPPICHKCGKPCHLAVECCRECRSKSFVFETARAVGLYDGNLREAIHKFKYNNGKRLGKIFAQLAVRAVEAERDFLEVDLVTAVPLNRKKEARRGYNQAQIFAHEVSNLIGKPSLSTLNCLRQTEDQSKLDFGARQKNVKGAFSLQKKTEVRGKSILLVDDVFTTGSTLNECTKVLLVGGSKKVNVLTIARATLLY